MPKKSAVNATRQEKKLKTESTLSESVWESRNPGKTFYLENSAVITESNSLEPDSLDQENLESIAASVTDALFIFDDRGILRYANPAAAEMLGKGLAGLTYEQLAKFAALSYPDGEQVSDQDLPSLIALKGETIHRRFYQFIDRNNIARSILISASPLIDLNTQTSGAVLIWKDVTEQEQSLLARQGVALAESRQQVVELLESIDDGFFAIDRSWKYTYVNQRAAQAGGLRPEELVGKSLWEQWPQIQGTQQEKFYRQAMEERVPVNFEVQGIMTDTWYEVRVYPSVEGIAVYWIDISERKQMEQRLAYHSLLLNTIHEAVMSTDIHERITAWNQAAEELSGWKAEEVIGKSLSEVILRVEPQSVEEREVVWGPLRDGNAVNQDVLIYRKDGSQVLTATTTVPVFEPGGQLIGYVSAARDITEQRRAEEGLQQAYSEMESRVKERTRELTELQWRLTESTEAERLRVSRELHDGPVQELYGLLYQASLMGDRLSDAGLQAELELFIRRINEVNENLRTIAYDLRPASLTQLGLEKAIREYVSRIQIEYPQLKTELDLQSDQGFLPETHRLALFRVCQVGLTNVIRHSQANHAGVRLFYGKDLAVLEIKDNGIGFELPKNLLSLARRGHLGLVGSAERIEALGGTLQLHSQAGKGTQLIVCLPVKARPE